MSNYSDQISLGTVVLAEDSAVVRAMVRRVLEDAGYSVTSAPNGQLAYELCLEIKPDIAVLNVEMPVLDGRELLKRLKSQPSTADLPVIFLTGRTSTVEIVEGLRMGAHDYLRKPFEPQELIARVSAAIRVARLQQQLSSQNAELDRVSRTDQLTGLHNRRHGEERLRVEMDIVRRLGTPLALLMIDVDHFKAVNDQNGHAGGDEVLRVVADRLQGLFRGDDMAARWGGEEFLVILPNTDDTGACAIAERFLKVVRETPVQMSNGASCAVTCSVGVAGTNATLLENLLAASDAGLYRAKHEGRDRLCLPPPEFLK